jgi:hypothetical protein
MDETTKEQIMEQLKASQKQLCALLESVVDDQDWAARSRRMVVPLHRRSSGYR